MSRVGFEPTIAAGERLKTYALDRTANGTGSRRFRLPDFHDIRHMKVVRSASRTGRLYLQGMFLALIFTRD